MKNTDNDISYNECVVLNVSPDYMDVIVPIFEGDSDDRTDNRIGGFQIRRVGR